MPETGSKGAYGGVIQARRLREFLAGAAREKDAWNPAHCLIKDVAQDQAIIRVDRGSRIDTYYGSFKGSDQDAQSEQVHLYMAPPPSAAYLDDVLQALHNQFAHTWHGVEQITETIVDLDALALKSEPDDEVSIVDESAEEWTPDRLANELLELDVENNWPELRELILLAEDTGFTVEQSAQLAPRLLDLAMQHRDTNDPQDEPAVWSAIRTGASMLRPSEANRLLSLLEPGHSIETSLVAIKMLGRIFEAQPPTDLNQYRDLACEAKKIADSLLNNYAIASSQSAAMAHLAIYALAAMGSNDILEVVRTVRALDAISFTRRTVRKLRDLREYWQKRPTEVASAARKLLERALEELRP